MFQIGNFKFGEVNKTYIIAEIGINHNGSFDTALALVDKAIECRVDAIKFQTFKTEKLVASQSEYFEILKGNEFSKSEYRNLFLKAKEGGIHCFSACFDEESVDLWNNLDAPAFKIASGDITHFNLLKKISSCGKPIILSTGASTLSDIKKAIKVIYKQNSNSSVALLHCVSNYPTKIKDLNLNCINTLKKNFNCIVGFSDHTIGIVAPTVAVSLGAKIIEKHFTLDKKLPGPDHALSADPTEMKALVDRLKEVNESLGSDQKFLVEGKNLQKAIRRSLVVNRDIEKGEIISESMLETKRPAIGLDSDEKEYFIGKKVKKRINVDQPIFKQDVE